MYKFAIIVAGGSGTRMGGETPKQFRELLGKPILWHTLKAFTDAYDDIQIVLVVPEAYIVTGKEYAKDFPGHRIRVAQGGETRFHSVKNGLQLVDAHALVFVHDGVRCLVTPQLIRRCGEAASDMGNAIPSIPASDTIRIETDNGSELIDRTRVRIIQTPQTFFSDVLKSAFEQAYDECFTDEASVVEKDGVQIHLVEGEKTNIKITTPVDLLIAEKILGEKV